MFFPDPTAAVRETGRVAKPSGVVVVTPVGEPRAPRVHRADGRAEIPIKGHLVAAQPR